MGYSLLVWNVEKYTASRSSRTRKVAELIRAYNPDVFGILEFKAKKAVRELITEFYDDYDFGVTDSKMSIDILVGWRRGKFDQVIYTQRRAFQAGNPNLRPGGLLSAREVGSSRFNNILFLHTDSGKSLTDYKNRQAMFKKVWGLNRALTELPVQENEPRLVVLGDLNTMGRKRTNTTPTIKAKDEINRLIDSANQNEMLVLEKSHDKTYRSAGGSLTGDLDHIIASNDLEVQTWSYPDTPEHEFQVECDGWVNLTGTARTTFIDTIADHALLYCEIIN